MAVAQQRNSFGVRHFTSNTSSGKNDRKRFHFHIRKVLDGQLAKEYHDTDTGRFVSEYNVPVRAGRTAHGLAADLGSVQVGKCSNCKHGKTCKRPESCGLASVQVEAPGRGTVTPMAAGSGALKPGVSAKLVRATFKANRITLHNMASKRMLLAFLADVVAENPGIFPMPSEDDAVACAIGLVKSKMLPGDAAGILQRLLNSEPDQMPYPK